MYGLTLSGLAGQTNVGDERRAAEPRDSRTGEQATGERSWGRWGTKIVYLLSTIDYWWNVCARVHGFNQ